MPGAPSAQHTLSPLESLRGPRARGGYEGPRGPEAAAHQFWCGFDQHGVQLGCTMSTKIRHQLAASRRTGATVQGFNQSTSSLLEVYLAHGQHGK